MIIIISIFFILCPIFSIPFILLASIKDKKFRKIYLIELAVGLGFLAYCWEPNEIYDLYVWQKQSMLLAHMNFNQFCNYAFANSEPIGLFIKYIIGKIGNVSLLQFFVVSLGYVNIFYIIEDSCEKLKISNSNYFATILFVLVSLLYLNFISGLFFTFALTIFAMGIYVYYYKSKKIVATLLILSSVLMHSSMIFPTIVFVLFLLMKSKISYKSCIIIFVICSLPNIVLPLLDKYTNIAFFNDIYIMYKGYFLSDVYNKMNAGALLIVNILISLPIYGIYILNKKYISKMGNFAIFINIVFWIIYITAPIFVRYVYLSVLLFVTSFEEYFNSKSENSAQIKNKKIIFIALCCIEIVVIFYQIYLLNNIQILQIVKNNFYKPIIYLLF